MPPLSEAEFRRIIPGEAMILQLMAYPPCGGSPVEDHQLFAVRRGGSRQIAGLGHVRRETETLGDFAGVDSLALRQNDVPNSSAVRSNIEAESVSGAIHG